MFNLMEFDFIDRNICLVYCISVIPVKLVKMKGKEVSGSLQNKYTKQQICNYLVKYQHLCDDAGLTGSGHLVEYIRKVGCVQYDPLDVVGRNPDLVLQARCSEYLKGDIEQYLYEDRALFDVWDKNMSICSVEDWPYFGRFRKRYLSWCDEHKDTINKIVRYLEKNEFACSSDFKLEERVDWHYGPQRLAKAALECMCYAGLAVVHHKKGARRYYCLSDKFIPKKYFTMKDPNTTDEEYFKWGVLRRINSIGALWNRQSDAWLGISGLKSGQRNNAFNALLKERNIHEIMVDGIEYPLYIAAGNLKFLQSAKNRPLENNCVRIIAPLDNLLWDRKLIKELFDFDYKWEVYTPAAQRKYGHYVLPVLCGSKFIGRIEMETDKKSKILNVKNFWAENEGEVSLYKDNIISGINRFAKYNLCDTLPADLIKFCGSGENL